MNMGKIICNISGHKFHTIAKWRDEEAGFIRATEQCTRCKYTYDWQPFYGDSETGIAIPYRNLDEFGEYLP